MKVSITKKADLAAQDDLRADALWDQLTNSTPAQIDAWIDANVTTVAQARRMFKLILRALRVLAKRRTI